MSRTLSVWESERLSLERESIVAQARGWTLHLKQRRQREYIYAARRSGARTQDKYPGQLDDPAALPTRLEMLPNEDKPAVGQQPDKYNQVQVCESGPERLHAINDLVEVGRLMGYRRLILVPVFIDPGVQAWTTYATSPACSMSDENARGADQTWRDRADRVRSTLVQVGSRGRPVMVGRVL